MRDNKGNGIAAYLLAVALGLAGALAIAHWSACEQDDRVCAFTGEPAK